MLELNAKDVEVAGVAVMVVAEVNQALNDTAAALRDHARALNQALVHRSLERVRALVPRSEGEVMDLMAVQWCLPMLQTAIPAEVVERRGNDGSLAVIS